MSSSGQVAALPVQLSATSHGPAAPRHTVRAWRERVASGTAIGAGAGLGCDVAQAGHFAAHVRARLQHIGRAGRADAVAVLRHVALTDGVAAQRVGGATSAVSGGQSMLSPSQTSGASQSCIGTRHSVPASAGRSSGQVLCLPSQNSAASQALPPLGLRHCTSVSRPGRLGSRRCRRCRSPRRRTRPRPRGIRASWPELVVGAVLVLAVADLGHVAGARALAALDVLFDELIVRALGALSVAHFCDIAVALCGPARRVLLQHAVAGGVAANVHARIAASRWGRARRCRTACRRRAAAAR